MVVDTFVVCVSTVVVVTEDEDVTRDGGVFGVLDGGYAVEVLADGALDELVLLVLVEAGAIVEMDLVKTICLDHGVTLLHVKADRQDSCQREIRVFNVLAVDLLIDVKQVRVLELLYWLLGNL